MKGFFITFEGCEGSGKSSQAKLLYEYLLSKNKDVLHIREPGGTVIGEKIREILLDKDNKNMTGITEALLYSASRAQLVSEVITPALNVGKIVICDRYIDSSLAYQAFARKLGLEAIEKINSYAINNTWPNITFYIRLEPAIGLLRNKKENKTDRLEEEKLVFHKLVFHGYEKLADKYNNRFEVIDGSLSILEINNLIISKINTLI